jgi:hypothetical protein
MPKKTKIFWFFSSDKNILSLLFGLIIVTVLLAATIAHATEQVPMGPALHASRPAILLALLRAILVPVVITTAVCGFVAAAAILYVRRLKRSA